MSSGKPCANEVRWTVATGFDVCQRHLSLLEDWAIDRASRRLTERAESIAAARANRQSRVYFVERDGFVKIGVTVDLAARMKSLTSGGAKMPEGMRVGPLRLLGTMPGTQRNEAHLHRQFAHLRIEGEWFLLDDELRDFIDNLACNRTTAA